MTGISIIEHADILMTTADRLLIHAHMLVDASLVTLIQTSFNGTKHNAMYLLESKAEKTCSLCLIFGGEERFYRFFSISQDIQEFGNAQGTATLLTSSPLW